MGYPTRAISGPTIVAIDWSGAANRPAQRRHIWVASAHSGPTISLATNMTREEVFDRVIELEPPVVVGFDFSFGMPAWFARHLGCMTIDDVWNAVDRFGENWLRADAHPFWGRGARLTCDVDESHRFRACEARLRASKLPAKSLFQLVGNGQVGPGSLRGMRMLPRLREAGFSIWPFDPPSDRTAVEIYPRAFRDVPRPALPPETNGSSDAFDASISALGMYAHRDSFANLRAATDETTLLEGDVWMPPTPSERA